MQESPLKHTQYRAQLTEILNHFGHVLPGQGPILDFVHHNPLHGYQHLPFAEALVRSESLTGVCGYLPESENRRFYQQGRINDSDLDAAFAYYPALQAEQPVVGKVKTPTITRKAIYRVALQVDLSAISASQLRWQNQGLNALEVVQADVPAITRRQLLADSDERTVVRCLWDSILTKLAQDPVVLHPEMMLDLSLDEAENWLAQYQVSDHGASIHAHTQQQASQALDESFAEIGGSISLRGFVLALSGVDILDSVRPQLIRSCASVLDEGVAAWHNPECSRMGLYRGWRAAIRYDANLFLHQLPDWQNSIAELPDDALDTIILQLTRLGIPQAQWAGYLQRLALELPGWSGMINWRQQHPEYQTTNDMLPTLADYLAIRLTLDRLWLNQVCHDLWKVDAKVSSLRTYFHKNLSEFLVRKHLYRGDLPEYLTQKAEALIIRAGSERQCRSDWQHLADLILTWQLSPMASGAENQPENSGWRLFRLCQHLGLDAAQVQVLDKADLLAMLAVLDEFNITERAKVWLYAYERHYRDDLFQALQANHRRGRWFKRDMRPEAQLIFCMDDREEGFRRHLEEHNPALETLGAAGFFGIAIDYQGLDDDKVTPLCPIAVTPSHEVHEQAREALLRHNKGRKIKQHINTLAYQGLRRNPLLAYPLINAVAPVALTGLLGKVLAPKLWHRVVTSITQLVSPAVNTQVSLGNVDMVAEHAKPGFTDDEQTDRVAGFLRNVGLMGGFAEWVVLMGHGSSSQNNPHLAAYDCGACSGRHDGPNARVFAAMANRPEIRKRLAGRGIDIPADTLFIGADHNTCNEEITWYDLYDMPVERLAAVKKLQQELSHAQRMTAHERCRRLASAPLKPTPAQALAHVQERAVDFSQVRPELGHATNAAAVIGRRALTQGLFLDRRVFLISYDPTQDADGTILEAILLAVVPVVSGVNLEYYFSTVNNDYYGCGTKTPHNITGLFGVMEGTGSDLRTGLPKQMVEIHEAMRLQIVIEAKTTVLESIYGRQPSLRELIAGHWVHLSVEEPDTGAVFTFNPETGFEPWQAGQQALQIYPTSADCYQNQSQPIPPALIKQAE
ncbi:MAG: DUF2309 domain-containing protein [Methylovulum sp.]|nr:DUF2309 domain-containing protein [Methylovulum sp.]